MPEEECLAAANAITSDLPISNRNSLLVNDWSGLPCGCFVWSNQVIDYDPNCLNAGPQASAQLVCRHPSLITGTPTISPTQWSPPPPVGFPAARSYDGHTWESVHPMLIHTSCDESGQCVAQIPPEECAGIHYIIESYNADLPSPEEEAAKLLEQATFGSTREAIDELMTTSHADWIKDQMNQNTTPPSLHRVHYRQRSNSHVRQTLEKFSLRDACEQGSRWNRWAFNR